MNPGLIHDEHAARAVPEPGQHVAPQIITGTFDIPVRGAQQPLHPIRGHRTGMLGHRPTVLALQTREQATQVVPDSPPRLSSPKPPRDQLDQSVQRGNPPSKIDHAVIITARTASASHDTPQLPLQY